MLLVAVFVVGMTACTLPAGLIAQRHGRRATLLTGKGGGVLAGLVAALAVVLGSFPLFCLATLYAGAYAAVVLSFRFAASNCAPLQRRPRVSSAVMAGGVFAGVLGPEIVTYTMGLVATLPVRGQLCRSSDGGCRVGVRPARGPAAHTEGGRDNRQAAIRIIVRQPCFVTAVICGVVFYLR